MPEEPDPDWFFDHVLYYARGGRATPFQIDEVVRWEAWWRAQARTVEQRWPELAAVALRHGFVLTAAQQRELGVTRATARRWLRQEQWSARARGAVSLVGPTALRADAPDRWTADRRRHVLTGAALAALNPGHVVTGRSAAASHGLPVFVLPDDPELSVPPGRSTRRRGARVAEFGPSDVTAWFGTPVSTVARTVVDTARAGRRDGIVVSDAALRTKRVSRGELEAALARAVHWPGVRHAREIVALADPRAESPLESLLRLAAHDSGLPAPELQVELRVPGRREPYRVDMLWPEQRLIVEADGRVKYRTDPAGARSADDSRWAEKKREVALSRLGYRIERVLWSDVVHTWPATYAVLAEALGR